MFAHKCYRVECLGRIEEIAGKWDGRYPAVAKMLREGLEDCLSVLDFLRVRTWLQMEDLEAARPMVEDAIRLARMEGLEAHARAAERRLTSRG